VRPHSFVGEIRHTITHRRIRAPVFVCSNYKRGLLPHPRWRWVSLDSLGRLPVTTLSLKALKAWKELRDDEQQAKAIPKEQGEEQALAL
jgi:hypothetical protein